MRSLGSLWNAFPTMEETWYQARLKQRSLQIFTRQSHCPSSLCASEMPSFHLWHHWSGRKKFQIPKFSLMSTCKVLNLIFYDSTTLIMCYAYLTHIPRLLFYGQLRAWKRKRTYKGRLPSLKMDAIKGPFAMQIRYAGGQNYMTASKTK